MVTIIIKIIEQFFNYNPNLALKQSSRTTIIYRFKTIIVVMKTRRYFPVWWSAANMFDNFSSFFLLRVYPLYSRVLEMRCWPVEVHGRMTVEVVNILHNDLNIRSRRVHLACLCWLPVLSSVCSVTKWSVLTVGTLQTLISLLNINKRRDISAFHQASYI